jgi:hypothetical protein
MLRRIFGPRVHEVKGDWIKYLTLFLMSCLCTQNFSGDKIENNELGVECVAMRLRRVIYRVLERKSRKGIHLGEPRINGRIILK